MDDIRSNEPDVTATTPGAQDDEEMDQLQFIANDAAREMAAYAEKHHLDLDGTTIRLTHNHQPKLAVTIAKYIEQEHREGIERIVTRAANSSTLHPQVEFEYLQSAG